MMQPARDTNLHQSTYPNLRVWIDGPALHVQFNRPEKHNALDGGLIAETTAAFRSVRPGAGVRAVVLSGAGVSFCAGADLDWMRRAATFTEADNIEDAKLLGRLLAAIADCPVPTVARVQGAALGGGAGLVACCDVVVAAATARFGFTEAKLGLLPAVISPYVLQKIGAGHARALFSVAERFDSQRALMMGLVHHVAPVETLDKTVFSVVEQLRTSAPNASGEARALIRDVLALPPEAQLEHTARTIARLRASDEGREGIAAFLEQRSPSWMRGD